VLHPSEGLVLQDGELMKQIVEGESLGTFDLIDALLTNLARTSFTPVRS
jgi:hypothetical protein